MALGFWRAVARVFGVAVDGDAVAAVPARIRKLQLAQTKVAGPFVPQDVLQLGSARTVGVEDVSGEVVKDWSMIRSCKPC